MTDADLHDAIRHAVSPLLSENCPVCGDSAKIADAVLAAICASGCLVPEVGADVETAAFWASEAACQNEQRPHTKLSLQRTIRLTLETSAPIIAAAAEAKAREECADRLYDAAIKWQNTGDRQNTENRIADILMSASNAIRTGAAS